MIVLSLLFSLAQARPAMLPDSTVITDTRASSVGLDGTAVFAPAGTGWHGTYLTTFTSTSSEVTANFGLHYLNFADTQEGTFHGVAASSMTKFSVSLAERFDNGVPRAQLQISPGIVPMAMVGPRSVEVDLPALLRVGVVVSPTPWFSLVPWVEGGFDLHFRGAVSEVFFDDPDVEELLDVDEMLSYELKFYSIFRSGLVANFHVGRFDFRLHGGFITPTVDHPGVVGQVGASLIFRWDKVVPAVLPNRGCPPCEVGNEGAAPEPTEGGGGAGPSPIG